MRWLVVGGRAGNLSFSKKKKFFFCVCMCVHLCLLGTVVSDGVCKLQQDVMQPLSYV